MTHRCPPAQDLARLLELPADDPRRLDAGGCPRCDAMLCALRAFLAGDPTIPRREQGAAERALARFIAQELVTTAPSKATRALRARAGRWRAMLGGWTPARTAALAAASALAAVMVHVSRDGPDPGRLGQRTRGDAGDLGGAAGGLILERPLTLPGGDLELRWAAVTGADRYVVELFDSALDTVAICGPIPRPPLRIGADVLARAGGGRLLVRVRALSGDALVSLSPLQTLAP